MNIFTVLASAPNATFPEEQASALLAWLLRPDMEHGLGAAFLSQLLLEIADKTPAEHLSAQNQAELRSLAGRLGSRLRSNTIDALHVETYLEYYVFSPLNPAAFVDIIVVIDRWVIAIENKIYSASVSKGQLQREYAGVINDPQLIAPGSGPQLIAQGLDPRKVLMVYLTPGKFPEGDSEFQSLSVASSHAKASVTWPKAGTDPAPSIAGIIEALLTREATGLVTPMPEYTRHTLKALRQFIEEGFEGYAFQGAKLGAAGFNPATEARLSLAEIQRKPDDAGFIGVQGGVVGLLGDVARGMIHSRGYQFTSSGEVDGKPGWLPISTFKKVVALENEPCSWDWLEGQIKVSGEIIKYFADRCPAGFYVGVQGGLPSLQARVAARVALGEPPLEAGDAWSIRRTTAGLTRTASWIPSGEFAAAVKT